MSNRAGWDKCADHEYKN